MKKIEIEELKKIQLDILNDVHDYCCLNNIKYSLAYGTLIGAVRHHGYIPWDDDIDIMMLREDYIRFVTNFNGYKEDLTVVSPLLDKNYYAPYANVINNRTLLMEGDSNNGNIGIKIDVFPIDRVPHGKIRKKVLFIKVKVLKKLINISNSKGSRFFYLISKAFRFLLKRFFRKSSFSEILDNLAAKSNLRNSNSKILNNIVWCRCNEKGCFNLSSIENTIEMEFEHKSFHVLGGYNSFLKNNYGNYMDLPPETERTPQHDFTAYWIN